MAIPFYNMLIVFILTLELYENKTSFKKYLILVPVISFSTSSTKRPMSKFPKGFIFGIISGSVIGSFIALLYAPDKGATTRDRISYRLNNYIDELSSLIDRLQQENSIVSDAKREGDLVVEEAQKRAEDLISEAEKLLENIGDAKDNDDSKDS